MTQAALKARVPADEPALTGNPRFYYALFAFNVVLVLGFWWIGTGTQPVRNLGEVMNALGRITGLLGTYTALWQLVLMARVPWLEQTFGFERLAVLHRWNGYATFGLLVAHAVFQTLGYQLLDGLSTVAQVADFITAYDGLLAAIIALLILALVVAVSITVSRRHLAYETWYFVHLYAYLAIALAFSHELAVGADFIANRLFVFYWGLLYAVVAASLISFRVVRPLLRFNRHGFRVQRVQREAPAVFSIYIRGRRLSELPLRAGQFAQWRFLDGRRWWQSHPFSISALPARNQLRLTFKVIGDFTSTLPALRPGTPVLLEGPFGQFIHAAGGRSNVLLIAGGIGITPLRALAEEMVQDGLDVCLLYRCRRAQDVVFREELDRLAEGSRLRVEYLFSERRGQRAALARLSSEALLQLVPDIREREIYVCGPAGMRAAVLDSLARLELERGRIHAEVFRLAPS